MSLEVMKTNVIHKWGFEHSATIYFFTMCEDYENDPSIIEVCYHWAINWKD